MTIHKTNPAWKLESKCLQTTFFPNHTVDKVAKALREVLANWGLEEKKLRNYNGHRCKYLGSDKKFELGMAELLWPQLNLAVNGALQDQRQKTESVSF